ncbi:RagB/SusD family nutrient uptake outer membrane protein [Bacteroides fragilis]|nr:RagB/SusD family nutrient uptake outer membrane protein [Bacteroides fragilis]
MKKIIQYLFLLAGGSFILSSCNDFLDKEPLDSVTPDNFFFNEEEY